MHRVYLRNLSHNKVKLILISVPKILYEFFLFLSHLIKRPCSRQSSFSHTLNWLDNILFVYDAGYEFDPGIHYIGEMDCNGSMRLLSDQLTEGQLQWVPLEEQFDTVVIGDAENARRYPVCGGRQDQYRKALYKSFPKEKKAIDQYMSMLKVSCKFVIIQGCRGVWNSPINCHIKTLITIVFSLCCCH